MPDLSQIRSEAEDLFRSGKFFCSEAVFSVINQHLGCPLPPGTVRLASGFPIGIGRSGCVCGALTGGVMALGLVFGRSRPGAPMPKMLELSGELADRFKKREGATCCREITARLVFTSETRREKCIALTGQVAADVWEMLERERHG
jgi:C_GCAxxG_C_C family probable redox protein